MSHEVSGAYGARAEQYHELLGTAEEASPREVELITRWAQTLDGPVIDAGAGSGRWTNYLNQMGLEVMGMDITPELVAIGRHQYPGVALNLGPMDSLLASDGYLAGILAWYSIIHTPPEDLPAILTEFNRALRPGGSVLLSYFDGPCLEPFDHPITTAWTWPLAHMTTALNTAGFQVMEVNQQLNPGHWSHAAIIAVKQEKTQGEN